MAAHSRMLSREISWTEEPGGLQFMGAPRVGHDWSAHSRMAQPWEKNTFFKQALIKWNTALNYVLHPEQNHENPKSQVTEVVKVYEK